MLDPSPAHSPSLPPTPSPLSPLASLSPGPPHTCPPAPTTPSLFLDLPGMMQQKRQFHWDQRKRRYVQLAGNEVVRGGKRLKTESGRAVDALKSKHGKVGMGGGRWGSLRT